MIGVLFAAGEARWSTYESALRDGLDALGMPYVLAQSMAPEDVDYIVYAPDSWLRDFTPYVRCKAVLNLWAGVERVVTNPTLTQPLARMVGAGLTEGMVEWVTGHVLRHHLGMDAHIVNPECNWTPVAPPLASERRVSVLGLGALGSAVASMLAQLGFTVTGWSRTPKSLPGIRCVCGDDGLDDALRGAQMLVLLLPDTPDTRNIVDADSLAKLSRGAFVINPGRGTLIDDDALIKALQSGQVAHATLDTFREEPLPAAHPYWHHPRVTVTPHVASETRCSLAAKVIVENIRRSEKGLPLHHLVDRSRGY